MSCLQIHDFIAGTTITLPDGRGKPAPKGAAHDIVRPNSGAAALVSDHLARLSALPARRAGARPCSKITAIAC